MRLPVFPVSRGCCMNSFFRQALIALVIPTLIIAGVNGMVFAAGVNPQIANISYWYGDDGAM